MRKASSTPLALAAAAGKIALGTFISDAAAQGYPTRPVTMIVPYAPGGTAEVLGRSS